MISRHTLLYAGLIACVTVTSPVLACDICSKDDAPHLHISSRADDHAPIGVMGDHMHKQGEWMLSYRFMHMDMDGNRNGTDNLTPAQIATTIPNRFSAIAGQPPTLRVVPTEMSMQMHMFGAMYAPTDWLTLMGMASYLDKEMDHITYQGMAGTTELGRFTTNSKGWGDTKVGGLFRLFEDDTHHLHFNAGISLPTGSIDETDRVLAPNGMTPTMRLPYGMQLGSGTFDALPGITYTGKQNNWTWGAQYSAQIPLESENDEGYRLGDKHSVSAWGGYGWADWISTSVRFTGTTQDSIHGIDPNIVAPVQTANPDNYGGETIDLGLGVNLLGTSGIIEGQRFAIEASMPLYRNLNGPQMEKDFQITAGWQYSF